MEVFSFERQIKHYNSHQKILLVGEGDFSFAVCLARAFGSAVNMFATSLDSRESLMLNYSKAMSKVMELEARGCKVLLEVDVHSMSQHPFLISERFDCIIYNFPHVGYLHGPFSAECNGFQNWFHQDLIRGFLQNASQLLTAVGEIHVTHKTTFPFSEQKIVELAQEVGLYLVHEEHFLLLDYPAYENKRGAWICDQPFPVGMCITFKFAKLPSYTTSGFNLGITAPGPWSGYSGIIGPHMQCDVTGNMPKYTSTIEYSKAYSSYQKILLVGEGDFSFAACLARAFGSAANIVATSLDSREFLMVNYSKAMSNLKELEDRGCTILHCVDCKTMNLHPRLYNKRFDRIIFNFPHSGYSNGLSSSEYSIFQILSHQNLVGAYFKSAREMLTETGEVHVTHKTTYPFSEWNIVTLALEAGLFLVDVESFSLWNYPGYQNKRGAGICDQTFPVGKSSIFKFSKYLPVSFESTSCPWLMF
ncbi:PREDICTED: At4g26485 [Prunus dulcis]|uniref:PREDICTED: At4g26485 n=1 Tax=Prunus dulcis TaxID=3755 RepID=A0A5E4FIF8_PRUDU|nr:uncharacterized protein LOC117625025 [Prunus dulcis]VVA26999.1 PREDICTED: At4g26485 [Prunus dulcis]